MTKRFSWCGKKNSIQNRIATRAKEALEAKKEWRIKLPAKIDRSNDIIELASEYIEKWLPDYENREFHACDLCSYLTDTINMMGYEVDDAWAFLSNHLKDARDEYEYEKDNYGSCLHNPFEEPDAFVTCIMINVVWSIISQIPYIDEHWNDKIVLTKGVIRNILSHLYPDRY